MALKVAADEPRHHRLAGLHAARAAQPGLRVGVRCGAQPAACSMRAGHSAPCTPTWPTQLQTTSTNESAIVRYAIRTSITSSERLTTERAPKDTWHRLFLLVARSKPSTSGTPRASSQPPPSGMPRRRRVVTAIDDVKRFKGRLAEGPPWWPRPWPPCRRSCAGSMCSAPMPAWPMRSTRPTPTRPSGTAGLPGLAARPPRRSPSSIPSCWPSARRRCASGWPRTASLGLPRPLRRQPLPPAGPRPVGRGRGAARHGLGPVRQRRADPQPPGRRRLQVSRRPMGTDGAEMPVSSGNHRRACMRQPGPRGPADGVGRLHGHVPRLQEHARLEPDHVGQGERLQHARAPPRVDARPGALPVEPARRARSTT